MPKTLLLSLCMLLLICGCSSGTKTDIPEKTRPESDLGKTSANDPGQDMLDDLNNDLDDDTDNDTDDQDADDQDADNNSSNDSDADPQPDPKANNAADTDNDSRPPVFIEDDKDEEDE